MKDWLKPVQDWLLEQLRSLWEAYSEFMQDILLFFFEQWMALVLLQWSFLPVPSFLDQYSMCNLLGSAGPTVGWVLTTFRIGEAMGMIAGGYTFRMLRKILTLFQW